MAMATEHPLAWMQHLQDALDRSGNTHTLKDVCDAIDAGDAKAWFGERSTVVTDIMPFPSAVTCRIWLAGGDLDELIEQEAKISEWARKSGCTRVMIAGRPGWERALPGYRRNAVLLTKELSDG